jgi:protocatechuate 3,4-dioxygenase beta subunit
MRSQALVKTLTFISLFCATATASAVAEDYRCKPTAEDELGPLYRPHASVRNKIGTGYLLMGTVKSAKDCTPLPGAKIEVWMAGPQGHYGDEWRASLFSSDNGGYYLESHTPPNYGTGRAHIHIKVSREGYLPLTTQHYPSQNAGEAMFDLVLVPVKQKEMDR